VQSAGVTVLSFEGHLRRGVGRPTLIRFAWTLTGLAAGAVLFYPHSEFGSVAKLIAYRLELNRRAVADLAKLLGKRAKSLPPLC
jgi:hypothetical protein